MMTRRVAMFVFASVTLVALAGAASAVELKVMGAGPVERPFGELAAAFARDTGHKVVGTFNTVGWLQDKLKAGEKADLLILSASVMEAMEKSGAIVAGSRVEVGRAASGFAVRAGAPAPDISTPDALKQALLAARSVAYVDPAGGGTTGVFFAGLLTRLGIADEINKKAIRPQRGSQVADAVADGRAEIGNTSLTELVPHKGVKVIGPIPDPLGLVVPYVGGIASDSANRDAARALLTALTSPTAREKLKAAGL
jgi:molybdate transport system substrate-binding protein